MKEDTTPIDPTWMEKTGGFAKDMTLHQWYAGMAMQGILADPGTPEIMDIVGAAHEMADAMLKAREK